MASEEKMITILEPEHLLDINDMIHQKSKERREISYSGEDTYPIQIDKIRALIKNTPAEGILKIATYYLKNIILLQPFADANHRTALAAVEFFLDKNGYDLRYTPSEAVEFQIQAYSVRLKTYGHYGQHNTTILAESGDDFTTICKEFIESRLTKRN